MSTAAPYTGLSHAHQVLPEQPRGNPRADDLERKREDQEPSWGGHRDSTPPLVLCHKALFGGWRAGVSPLGGQD